jgi:DNA repair protein RecO (recombination protein O)
MTQRSYKATGINLKAMPMGEADRLVTVLTREQGLVRAIAPGARKHKSRLAGRSGLFVVNDLLIVKGKSIDKLIQAETLRSFAGLSSDLAKLTASQYLAELVLSQALSEQPQEDLYDLLLEHLIRLETATRSNVLPCLAQAAFHLLALAGVAPEVFRCCLSRSPLDPDLSDPDWQVGFSVSAGGAIAVAEIARLEQERLEQIKRQQERMERDHLDQLGQIQAETPTKSAQESPGNYFAKGSNTRANLLAKRRWIGVSRDKIAKEIAADLGIVGYLSAAELALMQQLSKPDLVLTSASPLADLVRSQQDSQLSAQSGTIRKVNSASLAAGPHVMWRHIEKFLRQYAQYQFDRPIRSANLIDTCFSSPTHASPV